jgi:regulatory protein
MIVSAIRPQQRRPERVNVHVDGAFRLAAAVELVLAAGLRTGEPVSAAQLAELEQRDVGWKAREAALVLLGFRARSAAELRRRLVQKGFDAGVAEACVADLAERGMVDDEAYAAAFVRDRVRLRPHGRRRLTAELRARGVDAEAAQEAVAEVWGAEGVSEADLARAAAARWRQRPGEETARARRRLHGYLARRGFGSEAARAVLEERFGGG